MFLTAVVSMFVMSTASAQDVSTLGAWEWVDHSDDPVWDAPMFAEADGPVQITGGAEVAAGEWEDTVGIGYRGLHVECTGTLIAPNLVLTAGHCVNKARGVLVGSNDLAGAGGEWIRIVAKAAHPSFNWTYDAGVLLLEHDSTYEPRPVAMDCIIDEYFHDGANLAITGFGAIDEWGFIHVPELHIGYLPVTDHDCSVGGEGCINSVEPDGEFIAADPGGVVDACWGDSGGPAYLLTPEGDFVVGITSRGTNSAGWKCGGGTIYVRADTVVPWIETLTGISIPRPSCPSSPPEHAPLRTDLEADTSSAGSGCHLGIGALHGWWLALLGLAARRRQTDRSIGAV